MDQNGYIYIQHHMDINKNGNDKSICNEHVISFFAYFPHRHPIKLSSDKPVDPTQIGLYFLNLKGIFGGIYIYLAKLKYFTFT